MENEERINKIILEILTSDPRNKEHKQKVKEYKEQLKSMDLQVIFNVNEQSVESRKTWKKVRMERGKYSHWDCICIGYQKFYRENKFEIWNKINYIGYLNTPYNEDRNYAQYYYKGLREYKGFRIGSKYNPTTEDYDIYSYINNKITDFFNIKADRDNYGKNSATHEVKAIKSYEENMRLSKHYAEKEKEYQEKLDKMLRR